MIVQTITAHEWRGYKWKVQVDKTGKGEGIERAISTRLAEDLLERGITYRRGKSLSYSPDTTGSLQPRCICPSPFFPSCPLQWPSKRSTLALIPRPAISMFPAKYYHPFQSTTDYPFPHFQNAFSNQIFTSTRTHDADHLVTTPAVNTSPGSPTATPVTTASNSATSPEASMTAMCLSPS